MKKYIYIIAIFFVSITTSLLVSQSFRVGQIPNGGINSCANCHVSAFGGGPRNSFGSKVEESFLNSQGNVVWNAQLANLDSDGDGFSNGIELQNPTGIYFWFMKWVCCFICLRGSLFGGGICYSDLNQNLDITPCLCK